MDEIDEILRDNKSGAQEIVEKAGKIILQCLEKEEREKLEKICIDLVRAHPSMAPLWNLANIALLYGTKEICFVEQLVKNSSFH